MHSQKNDFVMMGSQNLHALTNLRVLACPDVKNFESKLFIYIFN